MKAMKESKKPEPWIKPRHRAARNLAYVILYPYAKWKYGLRVDRFREQGSRPYLILFNHQTPFDQFFVGMSFRGPVYYLATEDLFSNGWISSVIRWLVAPIPIMKSASDVSASARWYRADGATDTRCGRCLSHWHSGIC